MQNSSSIIFFILLCFLSSAAAGAEFNAGNVDVSGIGQTAVIPITFDTVTNGLAGYTVDISVTNPSVAEIIAIDYPGWAALSNSSSLPASEVRLKAVDLNREIQAGAKEIPIAIITIKSQSSGSTFLQISPIRMDDDNGNSINPPAIQRTLTVSTPGGESGSGGGNSNDGGTSSGSGGASSGGGGYQVQPVIKPNPPVTNSLEQRAPLENEKVVSGSSNEAQQVTQENRQQDPLESIQSGNVLNLIKANLLPIGILMVFAVILLVFAMVRRKP
jgi:hypothetical protein